MFNIFALHLHKLLNIILLIKVIEYIFNLILYRTDRTKMEIIDN